MGAARLLERRARYRASAARACGRRGSLSQRLMARWTDRGRFVVGPDHGRAAAAAAGGAARAATQGGGRAATVTVKVCVGSGRQDRLDVYIKRAADQKRRRRVNGGQTAGWQARSRHALLPCHASRAAMEPNRAKPMRDHHARVRAPIHVALRSFRYQRATTYIAHTSCNSARRPAAYIATAHGGITCCGPARNLPSSIPLALDATRSLCHKSIIHTPPFRTAQYWEIAVWPARVTGLAATNHTPTASRTTHLRRLAFTARPRDSLISLAGREALFGTKVLASHPFSSPTPRRVVNTGSDFRETHEAALSFYTHPAVGTHTQRTYPSHTPPCPATNPSP
jgi:hypothetical protein